MNEEAKAAKKQRLAEALRANLRRRKEAAESPPASPPDAPPVAASPGSAIAAESRNRGSRPGDKG